MRFAGDKKEIQASDDRLLRKANRIGGVSAWIVKNAFKGKRLLEDIGLMNPVKFGASLSSKPISTQVKYGKYLYSLYI